MQSFSNYVNTLTDRVFPNREAITLLLFILLLVIGLYYFMDVVLPMLISVVIAFVLHEPAQWLQRKGFHRLLVASIFLLLLFGLIIVFIYSIPLMWEESLKLIKLLPELITSGQQLLLGYVAELPFQSDTVNEFIIILIGQITETTQDFLSFSFASIISAVWAVLYALLIPVLVFFFLYDSETIQSNVHKFLSGKPLMQTIWNQTSSNLSTYIRGKIIEMSAVFLGSYLALAFFGFEEAFIVGLATGVAVLVPYVGAAVVALLLVVLSLNQFGLEPVFFYALFAYGVVQALDAYVLVPMLFSKSLNLRPITVLLAIIFFAGVWGIWGVLFAIPLATFIKVVISAWPEKQAIESGETQQAIND